VKRRDFITLLGGAAAAWPLTARAQQAALPVVAFVSSGSPEGISRNVAAFRKGLAESGYIEGQNVSVEYHWLEGQYERIPSLTADLVRRGVKAIAAPNTLNAALAAKDASKTIPIVLSVAGDPIELGLVASLARPGGNATGVALLSVEITGKRLGLLHELAPKADRIAVLTNPGVASTAESTLREIREAAPTLGLQILPFEAGSSREIETAFAALVSQQAEAVFVAANTFLQSRRVQLATLATRHAIPAAYNERSFVEAGGLMSYGSDNAEVLRQVGAYTGRILKGAKPADLPVIQSSKLELVINLATAHAMGLTVSGDLLSIADEVIE
jgi:putative ABC transport system substrate-binding protein